ncbi:MAG TPA: 4Fe-4S dicluster domain-containing protein [Cyclobacteriaceae bacterium]|nr:4Fe-4S dicluster domain-containing protein [Cyclobacteriaceae bacterium]
MQGDEKQSSRRKFLGNSLKIGTVLAAGNGSVSGADQKDKKETGEKIKVLTSDGKLIEIDKGHAECKIDPCEPARNKEARQGIPGRKFVMVVDLSRCKNARKCIEGCQKGHNLSADTEWLKVYLMKDNPQGEPYWFPRQCFHCDNPPCVKVCPVGATFKRQDNIVLVDVDRCIGCKFCIVACPYSVRVFNWKKPPESDIPHDDYSPESSVPAQMGTIGKCDFCPDRSREGKLPYCVSSCPMGALFFGDKNEDAVSNGTETRRFSEFVAERSGYRYLEELGTQPNVYYLPPVDRMFQYESGLTDVPEEKLKVYQRIITGEETNGGK